METYIIVIFIVFVSMLVLLPLAYFIGRAFGAGYHEEKGKFVAKMTKSYHEGNGQHVG